MKKLKIGLIISVCVALSGLIATGIISAQDSTNPLQVQEKIIALDAGHGGSDTGAVYPPCSTNYQVAEKDVNLAVVYDLKDKLEGIDKENKNNCVVLTRECDETIFSRKERVKIAKQKCQSQCGGECDILVSVHHNGSSDLTHDGTMAIYNHKADFVLAEALHDELIAKFGLTDEGYDHGGYGMTVYFTPASITEAYYITNQCEAELFLNGTVANNEECSANIYGEVTVEPGVIAFSCSANNTSREFNYGYNRVNQEAEALYQGLFDYFKSSSENGGDGGKPDNPGKGLKK